MTGISGVDIPFNNTETVDLQTGTLSFNDGGTSSGPFNAAAGTTLVFGGGSHTLQASSNINASAATVNFSGGSIAIAGSYNAGTTASPIVGSVTFTGNIINFGATVLTVTGAANFNSNAPPLTSLTVNPGTVSFSQDPGTLTTVSVNGTLDLNFSGTITLTSFNFTGGSINGTGNIDIPAGTTANWTGTDGYWYYDCRIGGNAEYHPKRR